MLYSIQLIHSDIQNGPTRQDQVDLILDRSLNSSLVHQFLDLSWLFHIWPHFHSGLLHIFKSSQLAYPPLTTYLLAPTYYTARRQVLSRPASFLSDVFNERHFLGRARSGHVFPVDGLRSSQLVFSFSTAPLNHLELYLHFYMLDTSHLIQTFEEACQRLRVDMILCGSPKMRKNRQFHKIYAEHFSMQPI